MKPLLPFLFLIISLPSYGQQLLTGKVTKKIDLDEVPSFFFKIRGDGSMIAFTVPSPGRRAIEPGKNKILNVMTGQITDIPGPHDPVFIGDLDLIITPTITHSHYDLFNISEVLSLGTQPIRRIESLKGFYQSTAVLEETDGHYSVRIIAERSSKAHSIIDFTWSKTEGLLLDDSVDNILCPNANFKLPMLSKDGKYVGGLDMDTNTSGVWEILHDYQCRKVIDLGVKTGKLNFSFDNSKLTYHIYKKIGAQDSDTSESYIPHPEITNVANIFVFDVISSKNVQITNNTSSNGLYPDFTRDGKLVFINHPHKDEKVSFVFIDL